MKEPSIADINTTAMRIADRIATFHRDFPNHIVTKILVEEREQCRGGYKFPIVTLEVQKRGGG